MAPTLPAKTRAVAPSSPRRKDPSSAAKRSSTGPAVLPAKSRKVPHERNKREPPPPPPSAASPTSPLRKELPPTLPDARSLRRRMSKEPSTGPTVLPAKNREAPPRGNKRKSPPPETSGAMDPPAKRKAGQFQRTWPPRDEVRILQALATYRRAQGGLPTAAELLDALDGCLEKQGVSARDLNLKQRSFKRRSDRDANKTIPPTDEHERRLYLLSRDVWGDDSPPTPPMAHAQSVEESSLRKPCTAQDDGTCDEGKQTLNHAAKAKSAGEQTCKDALATKAKTLDDMRQLYPYLVDEAMVLIDPAAMERVLPSIDDNEAQELDKKIKKVRKQLTKAVIKSARMKNMETSTIVMCQSTKLQPERSRVNEKDGVPICAEERLAQMEREIVELRQILVASQYQERIESNTLHDNSSTKKLQKKVEVPNGLPHGKNEVVTSKYKYNGALPSKKLQGLIKPPFNKFHGRVRKIDAESQTPQNEKLQGFAKPPFNTSHGRMKRIDAENQTRHNVGGKEVVLLSFVRPHGPVGKAILQNSSPSSIVEGMRLGAGCCKVFVSEVLKGDALLFRPNEKMEKMLDALNCSIAWPSGLIHDNAIASKAVPGRTSDQGH